MYEDLRNEIYDAAVSATNLGNRLHYTEAPQEVASPYCVFYLINQDSDRIDTNSDGEKFQIQFNLFAKDGDVSVASLETTAESIIDKIDGLRGTFSITGYQLLDLKKDFVIPINKVEGYWQISIQYTLWIEKL